MVLILASGLPGYLFFLVHSPLWSAVGIGAWAGVATLLGRMGRRSLTEPLPVAVWGCLSVPLIAASAAPVFAQHWHPALAALAFWAPPTLLGVLAVTMGLQTWRTGKRVRAALIIPLIYQAQLMFCGGLFALAYLFSGGSPI